MTCTPCRLGRTWECDDSNCNNTTVVNVVHSGSDVSSSEDRVREELEGDEKGRGPVREINTYKSDASLKDQQSTGRKRAAAMYPLYRDEDCEWKGKKNCGGGKSITGCMEGKQQARHHGPDKNTLNNDEGNVHRICHSCHNNWHALNDPGYVWGGVIEVHSPTIATDIELMLEKVRRTGQKLKNVED